MPLEIGRRALIGSLISLVAAPAIVRASSLMPIKPFDNGWDLTEESLLRAMVEIREKFDNSVFKPHRLIVHPSWEPWFASQGLLPA